MLSRHHHNAFFWIRIDDNDGNKIKSRQSHYANAYEQKQMTESAQTRSFVTMRTKTKAENKVMKIFESKNRNCVSHWMKTALNSFHCLRIHNTAPSLQYKYMTRRDVHFPITDLMKMKKKREKKRKYATLLLSCGTLNTARVPRTRLPLREASCAHSWNALKFFSSMETKKRTHI